jgi:hypothetical protein
LRERTWGNLLEALKVGGNLRIITLIDLSPCSARRTQNCVECGQFIPLPNQFFQRDINDVCQIITSSCRLSAGVNHDRLRHLTPGTHADVVPNKRHVSTANRTRVVLRQTCRHGIVSGTRCYVLQDGFWNLVHHYEVAQPLKRLQQDE